MWNEPHFEGTDGAIMRQNFPVTARVAVITSKAVGDSLLLMTVAHNLRLNGVAVTIFGRHAHALRDWFPTLDVRPELEQSPPATALSDFEVVLTLYPSSNLATLHPRVILLDHLCRTDSSEAMATRLFNFCREELALAVARKTNGLTAPAGLQHRQHATRIAIHPTASTSDKCWLKSRYIRLARRLRERGFDPHFVVAPEERADWLDVEQQGLSVPDFGTLDNVATWIYESGWFIGNDSGIGHLASNLEIPTLSLFMRRGIARTWRPDWGTGQVLIGSAYIPGARFKERFWKYALTVGRVERAFARLRSTTAGRAQRAVATARAQALAQKTA